jgi:sugar/nucleoside kinase (ribokinase family)
VGKPEPEPARILTFVPTLLAPRTIVLGDLVLDVVVAPERPIQAGTDVPGRVSLRQGGSAANTARWLARLGARSALVCSIGRDPIGRSLAKALSVDGVVVRPVRIAGARTGRIGVLVEPGGERSFVADRGAANLLRADDLDPKWFREVELLHLPAYSLIDEPLATAARRAIALTREAGGWVSLDLASIGPLLARGRAFGVDVVRSTVPDVLFATAAEAQAVVGRRSLEMLLDLAPVAIVKQGSKGATTLALDTGSRLRFEIATPSVVATDTTGAGDAFDAGFLVSWLASRRARISTAKALQRATLAGHRAAARHLASERSELQLG